MANLPVYDAPLAKRGIQPTGMGVAAMEEMGRGAAEEGRIIAGAVSSVGDQAKQVWDIHEKHMETDDISRNAKEGADAFAAATLDWNDTIAHADPNDTHVAEDWRAKKLPTFLDKIGADADTDAGRRHAAELRASLQQHFTGTSVGDQSTLAGVAVETNYHMMVNALSTAARSDPNSVAPAIDILTKSLDALLAAHSQIDPSVVAKLRMDLAGDASKRIATAAVQGFAEADGPGAIAALDAGKFSKWLDGSEVTTLKNYARTQGNVNDELVRRQNKEAASSELAALTNKMISPTGDVVVTKTSIADLATWADKWRGKPGMEGVDNDARTQINFVQSQMDRAARGVPAVTDPATYADLTGRMFLPPTDPNFLLPRDIIKAATDGKLSNHDYSLIMGGYTKLQNDPGGRAVERQMNQFLKAMKPSITKSNPMMGIIDGYGEQQFYNFSVEARAAFADGIARGEKPADMLVNGGKDYLGKLMPKYTTSMKGGMEIFRGQMSGTGSPLVAPITDDQKVRPGESMADWAKRTGH